MNVTPVLPSAGDRAELAALWAARLADGPLPAAQEGEFQAWLDADPLNGDALEEIVGAWESVESYTTSPEMMELREAALSSARRTRQRQGNGMTPRRLILASLAASVLLMVGAAGIWTWLAPSIYETGVGERRVVALSDGSRISLDGATAVTVDYSRSERRLLLKRGRAKFDVAKDPLRPFSVAAGDKVVVATGTEFSVELVQSQVRVVLYEGHVALLERPGEEAARPVSVGTARTPADRLMVPGRELVLREQRKSQPAAEAATVTRVDPVRSLSWEAGLLVFEDESLNIAVERINRYAGKPLAIGDSATASLKISGVFRAGDTDAVVQGLEAAFGVQARTEPNAIMLYKSEAAKHSR